MEISIWTVMWIVGGLVGILILGVLGLLFWDYLTGPYGPIFEWKSKRDARRQVERMSPEERAAAAAEARHRRITMQLNTGGLAATMAIKELSDSSNVTGLLSAFSLGDWQTRELVVAALGNICRDSSPDGGYDASEMTAALQSIRALCKADSTGGTYRQNCIDHAQMLLNRPELQSSTG
jgi:hypothetical protein